MLRDIEGKYTARLYSCEFVPWAIIVTGGRAADARKTGQIVENETGVKGTQSLVEKNIFKIRFSLMI